MPRIRAAKKARREYVLKNRIAYEKVEIPDITDAVTDNVLSIAAISQPSTTRSSTKFKNDEL
jgi:predicted amino acid-binding ACT domain protein